MAIRRDDDLPTVYVGQGDIVRDRIQHHYKNKDFWDWGIILCFEWGPPQSRARDMD